MRVPRVDDLGRVQVYVHVAPSGVLTPTAAVLQGLGAVRLVSSKSLGVVQAWVPVTALETLAAAPGVNRVSLPSYVRPRRPVHAQAVSPRIASTTASVSIPSGLAIDAGGLLDMRATGLIVNGMRGAGVKVGVISGDNAGLGASQAAGYLPATVWSDPNFPGSVATPGNPAEGTAMLEEVHAMAPDASLGFCAPQTTVELLTCYNDLIGWGATVITDDLGFFGLDMFSAGLTNDGDLAYAVAQISQAHPNVAITSAGGNDAQDFFQGTYRAGPGATVSGTKYASLMDFGAAVGQASNTKLAVTFGTTQTFYPEFEWNDPINTVPDVLDLYLVNAAGTVLASGTFQTSADGRAGDALSYTPQAAGETDYVEIACRSCPDPISFKLNGLSDGINHFGWTTGGSVAEGHSIAPGVMTTVAARANSDYPIMVVLEQFGAVGPFLYGDYGGTSILARPNLTGVDNVLVSGAGGFANFASVSTGGVIFSGTSATGPNVAGLIADIMSGDPGQTAASYYSALYSSANTAAFSNFPYSVNAAGAGLAQGVGAWDSLLINPIPDILSLNPLSATVSSPFILTTSGTGFVSGSTVLLNGTPLSTTYVSSTTLTAQVPAYVVPAAGSVNISVANPTPGAMVSGSESYILYNPTPTITSESPSYVMAGSADFTMTVTGTGFVNGTVLTWNGAALPTTFVSPTGITVAVPASDIAHSGQINLSTSNPAPALGGGPLSIYFVNDPPALLSSMTPTCASVGSADFVVTLYGSGFVQGTPISNPYYSGYSGGTSVWFGGGSPLSSAVVSPTEMTAIIPAFDLVPTALGWEPVSVGNLYGLPAFGGNTSLPFSINATSANQNPVISSLSISTASSGGPGFTLSITGSGFTGGATVYFGPYPLPTTGLSATQLNATVTAAALAIAGSYPVIVMNLDQPCAAASASLTFNVTATAPLPPPPSYPPIPTNTTSTGSKSGGGAVSLWVLGMLGGIWRRRARAFDRRASQPRSTGKISSLLSWKR